MGCGVKINHHHMGGCDCNIDTPGPLICTMDSQNIECKFNSVEFPSGSPVNGPMSGNDDKATTCPDYKEMCPGNMFGTLDSYFADATAGEIIDDTDVSSFYRGATAVARDRKLTLPSTSSNVSNGNLVNNGDYNMLSNWANTVISTLGRTESETTGTEIDASGWISIRDKLKYVAEMCNDNLHCTCENVCSCNQVCTCNCDSHY